MSVAEYLPRIESALNQFADASAGVTMAAATIESVFPSGGIYLLILMVALLSFSTIVTYWLYGAKCLGSLMTQPARLVQVMFCS